MPGLETEVNATPGRSSSPPSRRGRLARRVARVAAATMVLLLLLAVAHRPLLVGFAYLMRVDNPAPSGAIVVLLGGTPHRPEKAAELYNEGLAPVILLCRERRDPVQPLPQCDLIKNYLVSRLGLPERAVVILPGAVTSTRDEAQRVGEYLERHPTPRITVVTTAFHTARTRWIFRRVLAGRGIDVRAAAATDPRYDESNWYQNEDGLVAYFSEAIKTVFYRFKY